MFELSEKTRTSDRILALEVIDGTKPKSSTGLTDPRLFKGENKLHCKRDETSLWSFNLESGLLPEPIKGTFTTFEKALKQAEKYYATRNVRVREIKDVA